MKLKIEQNDMFKMISEHMKWVNSKGEIGSKAVFVDRRFENVKFNNVKLRFAEFIRCDFENVNFGNSDLRWSTFVDCKNRRTCYDNANLNYAYIKNTKM